MSAEIILKNGKKIDLGGYFETLEIEQRPKLGERKIFKLQFLDYSEIGYLINAILSVCRQALESENNDLATGLDYSRLLELATELIPHTELELLTHLHHEINTTTK